MARKEKKESGFKDLGTILDAGHQEVALKKQELSTAGQQAKAETTQAKVETAKSKGLKALEPKFEIVRTNANKAFSNLDRAVANHEKDNVLQEKAGALNASKDKRDSAVNEYLKAREDEERRRLSVEVSRYNQLVDGQLMEVREHAVKMGYNDVVNATDSAIEAQKGFGSVISQMINLNLFDTNRNNAIEEIRFKQFYENNFLQWDVYRRLQAGEITTDKFLEMVDKRKELALESAAAVNAISINAGSNVKAGEEITKYLTEHGDKLKRNGVHELAILYSAAGTETVRELGEEVRYCVPVKLPS